jgi:hypothetical protein
MEQNEYNCDHCGTYVPDGGGWYTGNLDDTNPEDDDRVCMKCYNKYREFLATLHKNVLTLRQKRV